MYSRQKYNFFVILLLAMKMAFRYFHYNNLHICIYQYRYYISSYYLYQTCTKYVYILDWIGCMIQSPFSFSHFPSSRSQFSYIIKMILFHKANNNKVIQHDVAFMNCLSDVYKSLAIYVLTTPYRSKYRHISNEQNNLANRSQKCCKFLFQQKCILHSRVSR